MDDLQSERDQFGRDIGYLYSHYEELLEQFPEQHVAIFDQKVVDAGPDLKALVARLRARDIPPEWTLIKYLTRERTTLILHS